MQQEDRDLIKWIVKAIIIFIAGWIILGSIVIIAMSILFQMG